MPDWGSLWSGSVLADESVAEAALEVGGQRLGWLFDGQSASEDLGLLGREFLLGEDPLRLQVGQLLQLRDLPVAVIRGGWRRWRLGVRLFLRRVALFLLRPAFRLAA